MRECLFVFYSQLHVRHTINNNVQGTGSQSLCVLIYTNGACAQDTWLCTVTLLTVLEVSKSMFYVSLLRQVSHLNTNMSEPGANQVYKSIVKSDPPTISKTSKVLSFLYILLALVLFHRSSASDSKNNKINWQSKCKLIYCQRSLSHSAIRNTKGPKVIDWPC